MSMTEGEIRELLVDVNLMIQKANNGVVRLDEAKSVLPRVSTLISYVLGRIVQQRQNEKCKGPEKPSKQSSDPPELSESAEDGLALCDDILELLDDIPDNGQDFADSVSEKVENIREWIEENNHATPSQMNALENMKSGAERWIRN